jgi:hypothetical protein
MMTMTNLCRLSILSLLLLGGTNAFTSSGKRRNHVLFSTLAKDEVSYSSSSAEVIGEKCEAGGTVLMEPAMIQKYSFPISPEDLIAKAKYALRKDSGVLEPSLWADDFEFCAPFVGPLSKEKFLEAAEGFNIYEAFPDFDNRYFGFTVDPLEPGRVWFFVRLKATNTGGLFGKEANNKSVELPPQVYSFKFNEQGLVRELTVGYSIDRRQGDTDGVGGMFGLFYGVGQGLPFPEGKPNKLSFQFSLFNKIGALVTEFTKKKS